MGRRVVLKNAHFTMKEELIQKMINEEGIKPFPLGTISPPPPRPPGPEVPIRFRVQERFFHLCNKLGLGIEATLNLWRIVVFSPILLLLFLLAIWFWRHSRRRR